MGNSNPDEFDFQQLYLLLTGKIEYSNKVYALSQRHIRAQIRFQLKECNSEALISSERVGKLEAEVWGQMNKSLKRGLYDETSGFTFKAWTNNIILRAVVAQLDRMWKEFKLEQKTVYAEDAGEAVFVKSDDPVFEIVAKKESRDEFWRLIQRECSALQFQVASYRYKHNLKPAEIAQIMGITTKKVSDNLNHFKTKMEKVLRSHHIEFI